MKGSYKPPREYGTLFLYLVDIRPVVTKREQRAQSARYARGGKGKINAFRNTIAPTLSLTTPPQKRTDKYQTHNKTADILTLFKPCIFFNFWDRRGGGKVQKPLICNCETAFAIATKFAQDNVFMNSSYYRYFGVIMT